MKNSEMTSRLQIIEIHRVMEKRESVKSNEVFMVEKCILDNLRVFTYARPQHVFFAFSFHVSRLCLAQGVRFSKRFHEFSRFHGINYV